MSIKDVKLRKGMSKEEVNGFIWNWLTFEDDVYLGSNYKHSWKCKCGDIFNKSWGEIRFYDRYRCEKCKLLDVEQSKYIKDVYIKKGMMCRDVNLMIGYWGELYDDIYLGNNYPHKWRCKCGEIISDKTWSTIRSSNDIKCIKCKHEEQEQRYKYEVEKDGEYEYIRSYRKGDVLPNGKVVKVSPYIQVKHKYCEKIYEVTANSFINERNRCGKCCGSYENSFAHHIEVELGEPLKKYWDFEKNTVNPYHIHKNYTKNKVWFKCTKTNYHGSYQLSCHAFVSSKSRCNFCHTSQKNAKVHPIDSFGGTNLYAVQLWSPENKISPFKIFRNDEREYKFICNECGNKFYRKVASIHRHKSVVCPQCKLSEGEKRITNYLKLNNINYISQKTFDGLVGTRGGNLSYDFYLPDYNLLIEYQGEFHDGSVSHQTEEDFDRQQEHDKRKKEYAKKNNIELLEIWYWDFDNIDEILKMNLVYEVTN